MEFVFSQICGFVVFIFAVVSLQLKNIKGALICQLLCNGLGAISYILLDGISGCGVFLVAALQSLVYFIFRAKDKKAPLFVAIAFILAFITCSVLTYKTPVDLIAGVAALTCALALVQEKAFVYRIFILANGIIWILYDLNVGAYTMVITHAATSLSAGIGIVRLDLKKKIK